MTIKAASLSRSYARPPLPSEIEIELTVLHRGQTRLLGERRRFNAVACGRRWGKTLFASDLVINGVLDGQPWGWFAPNYKILGDAWRVVRGILSPIAASVSEQDKRIELLTGGVVEFWTLTDPDAGRSRRYRGVVIDEAGLVRELESLWYDAIRPTLTDYRGEAWMFGTPKGKNFFYTAHALGQDAHEQDWASWQMPTLTNPFIDPAEIADAERQMPQRSFQQEYLAAFLDESGGVFRGVRACVDNGRAENEPAKPGRRYTLGVDLARVEDFTVLTVLDDAGRQVYHERFNQISWERQTERIRAVCGLYNRAAITLDSTGVGDPVYESCRKGGLPVTPFHFTNSSKENLIDALAMKIEAGSVRLMDIPAQTNELLAYQYELTPSRNVRMNAPAGMHDDCVIALALASYARQAQAWLVA
jgi:hypothetical protein